MGKQDEPSLVQLSNEILHYLWAYPQASDTVEGIVKWWLPQQRHKEALNRVQVALDKLVARGLVKRIKLVDGTIVYASLGRQYLPKGVLDWGRKAVMLLFN